ncbi:ATP-dependent helicase [Curtobacterium sp. Csp1]|uniref:DNA 3'-5' helicase n=1 Tax=Curtobacterium citreum TaxID=2036 RepID=A0ABT2HF08_9MICO|nr:MULTISPECIES: UrvD/REP family ATP-dependent DNA helicase [Curtobacterium]MCS6521854.1 PD-(D/E)XK nuclease family protein [Curtobacterium citreum]QKS12183.1 ATP-dependent helicase [Curtobacterium sp. csp3]QKS19766.1 ATP-dependent helicase [Curtobacterium sp. Csp1]TQJ27245.1 superfamily I DNA/RNA helicase [Curtobacterium citreum]
MPRTLLTTTPDDTDVVRPLGADPAQDAVLALPDGAHAAVLGAPGTGKTTTLARLVARRMNRSDAVSSDGHATVVALTSARTAATALRDRLAATVDRVVPGALARTVNSLAFQVVAHAAAAQGQDAPTLLTGGEQDRIIGDLLAGHDADGTGPAWPEPITAVVRERAGFRTALRDVMMRAVAAGIEPEDMRELGDEAGRPEWRAVGDFVDEYRAALTAFRSTSLDAAELVAYATAAVLRGQVPPSVAALRLVVVDDTQELVEGEVALLGALARSGTQVVAFGDPDIASSAFRGAEPDVLGRLAVRLGVPRVEEIVLGTVHRHPAPIRELVGAVTGRIGAAAAGRQRTAAASTTDARSDAVLHLEAGSRSALVVAVARRLREHRLLDGVPWHRMAVVTRSGAAIPELVRALSVAEVPATAGAAPVRPRDDSAARALLDAAAVSLDVLPLDADLATAFATGPLGGLDTLAMRRLRLALRREELAGGGTRTADELLVEALGAPERLATVDAGFARRATRLARSLVQARADADGGASIEEILWGLWERSGLAGVWGGQSAAGGVGAAEADRHLDAVVGLFTAAKRFVERTPDAPARVFVDDLLGADLPEDSIGPDRTAGRVRVLTPSATIGLECDVVVVLGLQDGVWPNTRVRGSLLDPDGLVRAANGIAHGPVDDRAAVVADELRLFARAVSRATTQVVVGTVANDDEAPSPFVRLVPVPPDRQPAAHPLSLRGLAGSLRRRVVTTGDPEAASALARLAEAEVPGASPDDWYGLAEPTTDDPLVDLDAPPAPLHEGGEPVAPAVSVSPSRIGTFEECPVHWFVQTFGGGAPSPAMGIGTIVHETMEHATDVDVESLWARVEARWGELTFESPWVADRERARTRRMIEGLSDYLRTFAGAGRRLLGAETSFALETGPARLRGSIDRIEVDPDGRVSVVDLKTGRSMPSEKNDMPAHPQLGAYQLAVEDGAVEGVPAGSSMADARLVFVQNPRSGSAYSERTQHAFDDEARAAYRERLHEVARGMAGRTFLARVDDHCAKARTGVECRIHVVGEVTW